MAGVVKGGNEVFIEGQLFNVVHEDIKIVQCFDNVPPLISQIFHMSDPAIQICRLSQGFNLDTHLFDVFSQFYVDQPKEVLLL